MPKNSTHKTDTGASIWIGTRQISNIYFNGELEIATNIGSSDVSDMLRNAGGAHAIRNLANICIILPMINNGIGIRPEYRSVINELNDMAKENPEWFHEGMWIAALRQVINGLKSSSKTLDEKKAQPTDQPQSEAARPSAFEIDDIEPASEPYPQENQNTNLKTQFNKF